MVPFLSIFPLTRKRAFQVENSPVSSHFSGSQFQNLQFEKEISFFDKNRHIHEISSIAFDSSYIFNK